MLLPHRIVVLVVPDPAAEHGRGAEVCRHVGGLTSLKHHRGEH